MHIRFLAYAQRHAHQHLISFTLHPTLYNLTQYFQLRLAWLGKTIYKILVYEFFFFFESNLFYVAEGYALCCDGTTSEGRPKQEALYRR
jgi:hypothetical protein